MSTGLEEQTSVTPKKERAAVWRRGKRRAHQRGSFSQTTNGVCLEGTFQDQVSRGHSQSRDSNGQADMNQGVSQHSQIAALLQRLQMDPSSLRMWAVPSQPPQEATGILQSSVLLSWIPVKVLSKSTVGEGAGGVHPAGVSALLPPSESWGSNSGR